MVLRLSEQKARSLTNQYPGSVIIGSDQVADLDGEAIGKPGSSEAAIAQLRQLSGREVIFRTGLSVVSAEQHLSLTDTVISRVHFRNLSSAEISRYVAADQPFDCAGSIKSEGLGITLFSAIESSDPTALIGLPLIRLSELLRHAGIELP